MMELVGVNFHDLAMLVFAHNSVSPAPNRRLQTNKVPTRSIIMKYVLCTRQTQTVTPNFSKYPYDSIVQAKSFDDNIATTFHVMICYYCMFYIVKYVD